MVCADTYVSMGNEQADVTRHLCGDEPSMPVVFVLLVSIKRLVYVSPQDRQDWHALHKPDLRADRPKTNVHALNKLNIHACNPDQAQPTQSPSAYLFLALIEA